MPVLPVKHVTCTVRSGLGRACRCVHRANAVECIDGCCHCGSTSKTARLDPASPSRLLARHRGPPTESAACLLAWQWKRLRAQSLVSPAFVHPRRVSPVWSSLHGNRRRSSTTRPLSAARGRGALFGPDWPASCSFICCAWTVPSRSARPLHRCRSPCFANAVPSVWSRGCAWSEAGPRPPILWNRKNRGTRHGGVQLADELRARPGAHR